MRREIESQREKKREGEREARERTKIHVCSMYNLNFKLEEECEFQQYAILGVLRERERERERERVKLNLIRTYFQNKQCNMHDLIHLPCINNIFYLHVRITW